MPGKFWEDEDENLIFPRHFTQRDEGPSGIGSDFDGESELSSMFIFIYPYPGTRYPVRVPQLH